MSPQLNHCGTLHVTDFFGSSHPQCINLDENRGRSCSHRPTLAHASVGNRGINRQCYIYRIGSPLLNYCGTLRETVFLWLQFPTMYQSTHRPTHAHLMRARSRWLFLDCTHASAVRNCVCVRVYVQTRAAYQRLRNCCEVMLSLALSQHLVVVIASEGVGGF